MKILSESEIIFNNAFSVPFNDFKVSEICTETKESTAFWKCSSVISLEASASAILPQERKRLIPTLKSPTS